MRVGIMAAGAVGGYFGARLQQAGHDVVFFARGENLKAMRQNGFKIESTHGDLHLPKVNVTDNPAGLAPVDVVLLAVKLWSTEEAGRMIQPIVGPDTRVITLMNGIDSEGRLKPILGDAVVPGVAFVASVITAPGVIRHTGPFAYILYGRPGNRKDAKLDAITETARAAKVDFRQSEDIERELWQKFVFLVGLSSATGALRSPLGPIMADPETRDYIHAVMKEVVAVGLKKGAPVPPDYAENRMDFLAKMVPTQKASLLNDLERGNRIELDWLAGKVVALGKELGVPTPANQAAYTMLKLHRNGPPQP